MKKKIYAFLGMAVLTIVLLFLYDRIKSNKNESLSKYDFAMGTSVSVVTYGEKHDKLENTNNEIVDLIKYYDEKVLSWRSDSSELANLNKNDSMMMSKELEPAVKKSYAVCEDSEGALDITLRPVLNVWNIEQATNESFTIPDEDAIEDAINKTGYKNIIIDENNISLKNDVIIDLGSTAKGYILDVCYDALKDKDIYGAIVTAGGSVMVFGSKDDKSEWKIGIRNPKGNEGDMIGYLSFNDNQKHCVSTSGNYEKYFIVDGVRYHHIIDPKTGYPAKSGLSSVTVISEDGLYSDALSTACYVLGYEKSLPLLEKYDAQAVFIDNENNIYMTSGAKKLFVKQ